jgi:hypothetical protein
MSHSTLPEGEEIEKVLTLEPVTEKIEMVPFFAAPGSDHNNSMVLFPLVRMLETNAAPVV